MKLPIAVSAMAAAAMLLATLTSASAAPPVSFHYIFNATANAYVSLQNASAAHDSFLKKHRANCGQQQHKWWRPKAQKDLKDVLTLKEHLLRATPKQRKKLAFHDLLKAEKDLMAWTAKTIPHLTTCQSTAQQSGTVNQDLSNAANDLGIVYYG